MVSFSSPVMLPIFINDERQPDALCSGYIHHRYEYDGTNKVEITPILHDPRFIGAFDANAYGQSYTIGVAHLDRLIAAANWVTSSVRCATCNRARWELHRANITSCCPEVGRA